MTVPSTVERMRVLALRNLDESEMDDMSVPTIDTLAGIVTYFAEVLCWDIESTLTAIVEAYDLVTLDENWFPEFST